jgi:hypothetical protein
MSTRNSAALWDRLYREFVDAEIEHDRLQDEVSRKTMEITCSGELPLADGLYLRSKTRDEARLAFEKYQRAKERFRAFIDEGIVPEDLRERARDAGEPGA